MEESALVATRTWTECLLERQNLTSLLWVRSPCGPSRRSPLLLYISALMPCRFTNFTNLYPSSPSNQLLLNTRFEISKSTESSFPKMVNLLICAIAAILCISAHASVVAELPFTGRLTDAARKELRRKIQAAGGCNVNVCFAIDGSGSISRQAFTNEKDFVLDVVSVIVDNPVELGAVQYASSVSTITDLTPDDAKFNELIQFRTPQLGGLSFVVGGINACFSQLSRRRGEALKLVLLGDGRSNIGSSAVRRANQFRRFGGEVCTVGAGFKDDRELLAIAGGDPDKVFEVDSFDNVLQLERIIEGLALGICKTK